MSSGDGATAAVADSIMCVRVEQLIGVELHCRSNGSNSETVKVKGSTGFK